MDICRIYNTYANKLREEYINYGSPIFYGENLKEKEEKEEKITEFIFNASRIKNFV